MMTFLIILGITAVGIPIGIILSHLGYQGELEERRKHPGSTCA